MEPTIHANSFVLGIRLFGELKTGDVIIFRHDGRLLVKRITATAGETAIHCGEEVVVPDDGFYVLGDNVDNSLDSRYWTDPFVYRGDVVGKVICFRFPRRNPWRKVSAFKSCRR